MSLGKRSLSISSSCNYIRRLVITQDAYINVLEIFADELVVPSSSSNTGSVAHKALQARENHRSNLVMETIEECFHPKSIGRKRQSENRKLWM